MKRISLLVALTAMLTYCQDGYSSGFFLIEQSVSSMGNAYAGGSAGAEDASTVFFNPAGMTKICGDEFVSGMHVVLPKARFHDDGSTYILGGSLNGGSGHDSGVVGFVPHSYFVKNYQHCGLAFGLGINAPFGLTTEYGHTWKGRYHAIRSAILTTNINPCVAMRINKCWSIGAGFNVMYIHAKFTNAVDFGLIGVLQLGGEAAAALGLVPQETDGKAIIKGNSWGYGGNIGVLWEPTCRTRFGAHFRSEIKHTLKGSEKFRDVPEVFSEAFKDTRVKADITLPSQFSISGYHEFNDCWAVMGDVSWTRWKTINILRFRFNNPLQDDAETTLKWQNSFRYSLGATYRPWSCWTFRTGVSYDETPIRNEELRTPRLPGEDRFWLACGVGYQWSRCIHIDLGYAHLFLREPKVDKSDFALEEDLARGGLKGGYPNAKTDIVSAQLVWDF